MQDFEFLGFTQKEWEILNGLASWLSAIGTIAAVIVSLWLARRQDYPRVLTYAHVSPVFFDKGSDKNKEYLCISLTNVGNRPIVVAGISLRFGLFRKLWVGTRLPDFEISDPFHVEIPHGRVSNWYIPLQDAEHDWRQGILSLFDDSKRSKINRKHVTAFVRTTTGKNFKARTDRTVSFAFSEN